MRRSRASGSTAPPSSKRKVFRQLAAPRFPSAESERIERQRGIERRKGGALRKDWNGDALLVGACRSPNDIRARRRPAQLCGVEAVGWVIKAAASPARR